MSTRPDTPSRREMRSHRARSRVPEIRPGSRNCPRPVRETGASVCSRPSKSTADLGRADGRRRVIFLRNQVDLHAEFTSIDGVVAWSLSTPTARTEHASRTKFAGRVRRYFSSTSSPGTCRAGMCKYRRSQGLTDAFASMHGAIRLLMFPPGPIPIRNPWASRMPLPYWMLRTYERPI